MFSCKSTSAWMWLLEKLRIERLTFLFQSIAKLPKVYFLVSIIHASNLVYWRNTISRTSFLIRLRILLVFPSLQILQDRSFMTLDRADLQPLLTYFVKLIPMIHVFSLVLLLSWMHATVFECVSLVHSFSPVLTLKKVTTIETPLRIIELFSTFHPFF